MVLEVIPEDCKGVSGSFRPVQLALVAEVEGAGNFHLVPGEVFVAEGFVGGMDRGDRFEYHDVSVRS